jgi:hypothetical protein
MTLLGPLPNKTEYGVLCSSWPSNNKNGLFLSSPWPMAGIMVVLIWLVLLLLQSSMMVAAEDDDDFSSQEGQLAGYRLYSSSSNCFAEPIGMGECGLDSNATEEPTNATYFTARFGIPTTNNKKNGNGTSTTTAGGGPRVKYCLYGWQVIENAQDGFTTSFIYTTLNSSELTASDPNCTDDCSAVVSSHGGHIKTEPSISTIRHRFYMLQILEGQEEDEAATRDWNPFPNHPGENQPPKYGTLQVTADGCTFDVWDPVPTSTPSLSPPPTSPPSLPPTSPPVSPPPPTSPPVSPLDSMGGGVAPTNNPPPLDSSSGRAATTASCWMMWTTTAAALLASRRLEP